MSSVRSRTSTSPSYAIDSSGVIRWVNPAALRLVGDVRGRQFTLQALGAHSRLEAVAMARREPLLLQ